MRSEQHGGNECSDSDVPASPYPRSLPCASLRTAFSASGSTSGIFVREPLEAYGSWTAHQIQQKAAFLGEVGAYQAYQGVVAASSCPEAAEAFWEGSSSSWTRDKVGCAQ